jgi:hypothetical protein
VDFFSRQVHPLQRAADGGGVGRFADRLGYFHQRRVGLAPDQFADRMLVGVVVGALLVVTRRRQRFERAALATLLDQPPHPRLAAAKLLGHLGRRAAPVVCPGYRPPKVHRICHP